MDTHQISAFIDDELSLDDKIGFVESVHADTAFKNEAVDLLRQEVALRAPTASAIPEFACPRPFLRVSRQWLRPVWAFAGGLVTALLVAALFFGPTNSDVAFEQACRFVIYQPGAHRVAVMGSFNQWQALEMEPAGSLGYWEINVPLPPGEYRYSFLLDDGRQVPDPTRLVHERDDFGGQNSIISVSPVNTI
jgi:hypothetical protein